MDIEREEIQPTGTEKMYNRIMAENSSILRKRGSSRYRRFSENQTGKIRKEKSLDILIVTTLDIQIKERILNAVREKQ
jgi:hypothetical protein